ncbi:NADH-dependent dyhydrogenase [Niallia circulans]|uniref:Gfo/Idh/MocA family protein n=1 Tax=Niallia circulans TaxID=1397 RepID=UPI00077CC237|nr:Gfo/Idh/MocA family oxidoreductase [Niallia circulans]MDR4316528.1 Gfo/Idh/MocA family oxidoreductase [Niallia circulans]MED3838298.1 Gfo/Idh/MocA family oxidoreductase [Niallia circulans]MED4243773.1 Gfo/Idh/MocA family oxidoreductase [Niallia circulans]MED4246165.1 Gfo/Idh/MocA family oxidoreductase [Niallia circulans]QKH63184.1 Gfo/Idh/MocA family oxidoreductase [Niallia circulans]
MLKALVIGAGTMGSTHSFAYSTMDDVQLAGIVDKNLEKAEELARKIGVQAFASYEEAIESLGAVDVVSVCVPTPSHKEYVIKAADDCFQVVCEKPLARNLRDAKEMIDYCKEKGVKLFVGHVVRFFLEYQRAKRMIEEGKIGKPGVVNTKRGGGFPSASRDWYADYNSSGGLVLDLMIHDFDYLRWCFGEVERVYAKSAQGRAMAKLDYALVTLRFESGVIAHLEGTWAHQNFATKFEIAGKKGIIHYDSSKSTPLVKGINHNNTGSAGVAVPESPLKENPYITELKHFISCIKNKEESIVTPLDAYKAMEIALAAIESLKEGKVVELRKQEMEVRR